MRRILMYGVSGSGKSTPAARIGARLGLPYHAIDDLTWEPGWVPVSLPEQRARVAAICAGEAWVIDAGYAAWLDVALARTEDPAAPPTVLLHTPAEVERWLAGLPISGRL